MRLGCLEVGRMAACTAKEQKIGVQMSPNSCGIPVKNVAVAVYSALAISASCGDAAWTRLVLVPGVSDDSEMPSRIVNYTYAAET
jgi:hypothetical protein